jgi:hypothetical protein
MKTLSISLASFVAALSTSGADKAASNPGEIYFPHEHVQKLTLAENAIPFEKRIVMNEHDAIIIILPEQKSVSVWCHKPDDFFPLAEQATKSRLKTEWGEKPWIKPRMKYKNIGGNSYSGAGLDSYIELGGVVTTAGKQSDYSLYVGRFKFSIIEDLTPTNALSVTIKVERTNRQPLQEPSTK